MASDDDTPQAAQRRGGPRGAARTGMRVQFRLGDIEEAIITKASKYTGLTVHGFIRSVTIQAARSIVKRHELDGERQHGFDVALFKTEFGVDLDTSSTKVNGGNGAGGGDGAAEDGGG